MKKKCSCCKQLKSANNFYKCPSRKDGLRAYCKSCSSLKMKLNREYYRKYNARRYKNEPEFKRKRIASNKKYHEYNKLENVARYKVSSAIRSRKLTKQPCIICGKIKVVAHHKDYTKPLEVIWLCPIHHKRVHIGELII